MRFLTLTALSIIFLSLLTSCDGVTATPNRKKVEVSESADTEQSWTNSDAMFDAHEKSLSVSRNKTISLELQISLADVQAKGKADPVKYPPADVVAETARLYALAEQRRRDFSTSQANFRAIHDKDIATNRAAARKAAIALNPPANPIPAPVNLTTQVNAATGTVPAQATLIPEPSQ